jgi:hypothetical protein
MLNFNPKGWRHIQGIYTNNVHKSNRQRHSKNVQIKWKQIDLHSITIMHYPLVPHEGYGKPKYRRSCAAFSI